MVSIEMIWVIKINSVQSFKLSALVHCEDNLTNYETKVKSIEHYEQVKLEICSDDNRV